MLVILLAAPLAAKADPILPPNKSELLQSLLPTVVNIATTKSEPPGPTASGTATADAPAPSSASPVVKNFVGSGFIIDSSGLIVTNYHVVENAFVITVTLSDGTRLNGKQMAASRLADIALVKIETNHPLTAAKWGDSDKLGVGDQVFAIGNPFGIGLSVSAGIVSGLNRDIQNSPYDDLIQTDATINHGNSGGPLFNMDGLVVGVNSAIISPTPGSSGLGFAIPSRSAHFVVDRLVKYGWVRPAWIGVKLQQVTDNMAAAIGLSQASGSIIAWVRPDAPSAKAGLQIGDVIIRINNIEPSDERALLRTIAETNVGDAVTLSLLRDGKRMDTAVTTEEWPRTQWDKLDAPAPAEKPKIAIPPDLGLKLSPLPDDERTALELDTMEGGVLIDDVTADTGPAQHGIKNGDVILRVGDKIVTTPEEVLAGFAEARSAKREWVMVLVWPKVRQVPGPKWYALQVGTDNG